MKERNMLIIYKIFLKKEKRKNLKLVIEFSLEMKVK